RSGATGMRATRGAPEIPELAEYERAYRRSYPQHSRSAKPARLTMPLHAGGYTCVIYNGTGWMRHLPLIFLCFVTGIAFAGEYAVFASGSRLRVDRHETSGDKVRLYNAGGYIEMDAAAVRGFEAEEYAPPA